MNEKQLEFKRLADPLIEWLNNNYHPHAMITIDCTHAEISEGVMAYSTYEFVND